uniref:glycosyltransferase n=1 Tax=uncultured Jatrophihabitans sp. TaxID=1610747 RepID=UPI0035CACCF0
MKVLAALGAGLAAAGAVQSLTNARALRRPVADPDASPARVPVLIPARDEAAHIGACVQALRGQGRVTVLDDASSDATAQLARAAGAHVVPGTPLPPGWLGKPWACAQLAAAADGCADVLVFVDADVRVAPGGVQAAVALLETAGLDVLTMFPRQIARSGAERLLQPLLQWSWMTLLPLRLAERSPRPSLAAACGQFVVIRRAALARVGGFAALRGAVLDDLALVRAVKAGGGRVAVADGSGVAGCRMYDGWPQVRDGYTKSLWSAYGTPRGAAAGAAVLALGWVVPAVAALRGSRIGALGYAAGVLSRVVAARCTGGRAWPDALVHPLSVSALNWLTLRSVLL